ncbi:Protein eva-1 C [Chionoecetes opilio]|uniref:Protein eva-1 C n=1 Tax=Chionoecetes opilio TaxID=41210 RepID=A0A8J4YPK3_CHIOP|nr:Protein eva-1 C [Chionoecetes opilio]
MEGISPPPESRTPLLAGTLRTFQQHACDGASLFLHCPNHTTIDIAFARYGRPRTAHAATTASYNTLQLVVNTCQHKQHCNIEVAPKTFSPTDPCPSTRKYIEVAYKCRPKTFINKVVCEGGELDVRCDKDARIAIYSVLFGRSRAGSFTCPQPEGVAEEECQASYANEIVMQLCHGQRQCHLVAKPEVFGSPCSPHSNMYMKTVYTCVPKKILKETQDTDDKGGEEGDEEKETMQGGDEAHNQLTPTPDWPPHHNAPTSFYNPTVTTWLADKKSDERPGGSPGAPPGTGGPSGAGGVMEEPPERVPSQPELINCTVVVLSGAPGREIGFLTEWMKAVAFVKSNFEKFLLYLLLGLFVGLVLFLFVVVGQLLWERRRAKKEAKTLHDPLTSVFAADIEDIDGDLDLDGTGGSIGGLGGGSLPRSPSPQDSHRTPREVIRYNAYSTYGRRSDGHDGDGNPLSLTRTNNNQLFYS